MKKVPALSTNMAKSSARIRNAGFGIILHVKFETCGAGVFSIGRFSLRLATCGDLASGRTQTLSWPM